jgi:hypothetical protein
METDKQKDRNSDSQIRRQMNRGKEMQIANKERNKQIDRNSDSRQREKKHSVRKFG